MTTKIHALVDALGNPLCFRLTPGNQADCTIGYEMLAAIHLQGKFVLADRGYDTDRILRLLDQKQAIAVIPSRKHRTIQRDTDWWMYKERHLVEGLFNKLKNYRRLATRYDKLATSFSAFLSLAAIVLWLA